MKSIKKKNKTSSYAILAGILMVSVLVGFKSILQREKQNAYTRGYSDAEFDALSTSLRQYKTEDDCSKNGGIWNNGGFEGPFCDIKYKDGGKTCSSSAECQGLCINTGGGSPWHCEERGVTYGCHEYMVPGSDKKMSVCVD